MVASENWQAPPSYIVHLIARAYHQMEAFMDFGDLYQDLILDHNRSPRNRRGMDGANMESEGYNPLCGDRVTIRLKVEDDVIVDAAFEGSGCAISTASASLMTEALKDKTIDEVRALFIKFRAAATGEMESDGKLGKLESLLGVRKYPARVKCATLAWHTVIAAIDESTQEG